MSTARAYVRPIFDFYTASFQQYAHGAGGPPNVRLTGLRGDQAARVCHPPKFSPLVRAAI